MMEGLRLLPLHWCARIGDSSDPFAYIFAHEGAQSIHNASYWPSLLLISWLTSPSFVDALLTQIFRMGQGVYGDLFSLQRQPISHLWISATNHHSGYPKCKTKTCLLTVDAHFQNGIESVTLSILVYRPPIYPKKIMPYQSQYFAIISRISECYQK